MIKFNIVKINVSTPAFKGIPQKAPSRKIYNAQDAINQWEVLKHPQYTEIIQEEEAATPEQIQRAKQTREENYSFLDELKTDAEKAKFIRHFQQVTGFPILKDSTQKLLKEYERVLRLASKKMDYARDKKPKDKPEDGILMAGYDEFCSAGQDTALPGSDLDKAYAIVTGSDSIPDKIFSARLKGHIWNNIDNRLMSVNHTAAFPNIMTFDELKQSVQNADYYASKFMEATPANIGYFGYQRLYNPYPVPASKFNILLSQQIPSVQEKYEMKNLAYIVEAMRDGKKTESTQDYLSEDIYDLMANSVFCRCSNVIQSRPMQDKYDYYTENATKEKLKARKQLEQEFERLSIKDQYEIVTDVIRSMSGDSKNPDLKKLFHSPPDRHRLLINDILRGRVDCNIVRFPDGSEQTFLNFNDSEVASRYYDINVYDLSHK